MFTLMNHARIDVALQGVAHAARAADLARRYAAERVLLQTALIEMNTLDEALRKVTPRKGGFDANFVGMTEEMASLACRRLTARQTECSVVGP